MITVGVGVGCAFVINDKLVTGHRGLAGSVDHWPLLPDGPECDRGHRGCADVLLTSSRISLQATEALGRPFTFEQCLALAIADDELVVARFEFFEWARGAAAVAIREFVLGGC